jgi:hypothetical protein
VKYQEIKSSPRVGREFQHLEDLVFVEGSSGAQFAIDLLESLANKNISVKWDGNPTIYWGRNSTGDFVLVNKNAWGRTLCTSADMLEEFIMTTGRGEPWRQAFAESLTGIWSYLESATPHWFRGYLYGDLLFYPTRPSVVTNESIEFTPNKVTYAVNPQSALGQRMFSAKVGIAVHKSFSSFGSTDGNSVDFAKTFESADVALISQTRVNTSVSVGKTRMQDVKITLKNHGQAIDQFLTPVAGLSDMKNIIYTYVNQTSKAKNLSLLGETFTDWLAQSKVSSTKQAKILALVESNPTALPAIFGLVKEIMHIKNSIIEQLDTNNHQVRATTLNETGGEGYIMLDEKIKLVPRHRWVPD